MSILLASGSPQRSAILTQLQFPFRVSVPEVKEQTMGNPHEVVLNNAHKKAEAVAAETAPDELIIACDTLVDVDGIPFGKPETLEDAHTMLMLLKGRVHEVVSGLVIAHPASQITRERVVRTKVRFRAFSDQLLSEYLASEEWQGRAGGYAIQGLGAAFVSGIGGCYQNVVGLPVAALLDELDDEAEWSELAKRAVTIA